MSFAVAANGSWRAVGNLSDLLPGETFSATQPDGSDPLSDLYASIDAERSMRWLAGFPVDIAGVVRWFHSDEFSITQYLGLKDLARDVLLAGGNMSDVLTIDGADVVWYVKGGFAVTITAQIAFDVVASAMLYQKQVFDASLAHRAAIALAPDPSAYDLTQGWPEQFNG